MATKTQLESENRALRQKFATIGKAAIEFADERGYCEDVEEFLREHDIPFPNSEPVEFVMTLRFTAKPTTRAKIDAGFIESDIQTWRLEDAFDEFEDVEVEIEDVTLS